ncbi:MAG TPA: LuxR C-terminal-related transcriptional regulator, partial [Nitrolancea sp.]|nr:LuxR C-terminal-related transcriptional regulator [Nitrolancea sp.]
QRPLPLLVTQVIEGRLARLDEKTRGLLQVAAIVGQDVPLELWQRVSAAPEEALAAAIKQGQDSQLIEEAGGGERYHFRHALLRLALYEEVVAPSRRPWHRRVAEALAETPNPDPDQVAHHLQQAGDARAIEWLIKAGERAQLTYAWEIAAQRFDAALSRLTEQGAPAAERAVLLRRMAELVRYMDSRRALALVDEAQRLAQEAGEPGLALTSQVDSGLYLCFLGDYRAGLDRMVEAVDAFAVLPTSSQARAWELVGSTDVLAGTLVQWLTVVGRLEEAHARGLRLLDEAPAPDFEPKQPGSSFADGLFGLARAQALLGEPANARRTSRQARAIYHAVGHHLMEVVSSSSELEHVQLPYFPEQLEERRLLAEAISAAARRAVQNQPAARFMCDLLPLQMLEGNWVAAREALQGLASGLGVFDSEAAGYAALLAHHQGEPGTARELIAGLLPQGPRAEPGNVPLWAGLTAQLLAAELALDASELALARAWLEAHDRWLGWSAAVLGRSEGALAWAAYHRASGDLPLARRLAAQALEHASDPRQPLAQLAAQRFLGQLHSEARQFGAAESHLEQALALAAACAAPFERALTLLELARLRTAQGRPDDARVLLAEVRTLCLPLDARPTLQRVDELERQLDDAAARRGRATYPAGLSAREVAVLRLVAQGLTDAQVAEQLFISRRTVSSHLLSIYNKLGVPSRAAATRFAVEHQLL